MLVTIIAFDKPDSVELRMKTRPAHIEWIEKENLKSVFIGPLLSDDGQTPIGSLFVFDAPSLADARALASRDPYAQAGLFERTIIQPARQVYPK
ncbi:MAG: YciI family protein [Rhodobacteraceae bacterium]|nr:YciI family protein [Paracoccaceae bacterium]